MFHCKTFHPRTSAARCESDLWHSKLHAAFYVHLVKATRLTYSGMKKVFDVTPVLPFPIISAVNVMMISNTASGVVTSSPFHIDENAHKQ